MGHFKLKKRTLKSDPAIILAGFGTTSNAFRVYEEIGIDLAKQLPESRIAWAYTSEIVREKKAYPGLFEAIAGLESEGYRKIVVQPLHIFPATEYRVLESVCAGFSGIRIIMGETLAHRWPFIEAIFDVVSTDFLTESTDLNIVVAHGSPLAAEPANVVYQGLDAYCSYAYDNVCFTTIDGMPSLSMLLRKLKAASTSNEGRRARVFPLMLTAGKHVHEDLLEGDDSLQAMLAELGFKVDFPYIEIDGNQVPKTLGAYPGIIAMYHEKIERALELFKYY